MKTKLFTFFVALFATTCLWAYDFKSADLYYRITSTSEPYTVEVTRNGGATYTLTSVVIPSSVEYNGITYAVTSIGELAFYCCSSLTSVTIPNSVTSIGSNAFYLCPALTSVAIGNGVLNVGNGAFRNCSGLTSITIPNSVTSIGDEAFYECFALTSVSIGNGVTNIGNGAFRNCSGLTSITIPNSVTSIGDEAFYECFALTSVSIGNGVTNIGEGAFIRCIGLIHVTIPNSVTNIKHSAFYSCTNLSSVSIPNCVTNIGNWVFEGCESLKEIICYAKEIPTMGYEVFLGTPQSEATLYVPANALNDYKTAYQWKEFGTILPIDEASTDLSNSLIKSLHDSQKFIHDGQLLIIRDGKTYNVMGAEIK